MSVSAEISGQNFSCSLLKTTVKTQRDTRVKLLVRVSVSQIMVYLEATVYLVKTDLLLVQLHLPKID